MGSIAGVRPSVTARLAGVLFGMLQSSLRHTIGVLAFALPAGSPARAQSPARLWILQVPDQIVEYDVATLVARRSVTVPRRLLEHPEYLSVNAAGQMMFLPPNGMQWAGGEMAAAQGRVWFWDGRQARERKLDGTKTTGGTAAAPAVTETALEWFLSAGGESLFWFENTFEKIMGASGGERSVRTTARVWRTDLAGAAAETTATLTSPARCRCTTGVCSESCPEWSFWAPDGVVDDFFLLTRVTPGQTEATYHESLLYQRSGPAWLPRKLPKPVERALTASEKGELLVAAVPDAGCCGWENESNDQTLLWQNGKSVVLYDEVGHYDNRDYDVSFYSAGARLAAGGAMLAHTIVSTAAAGGDVRLSDSGKDNAVELTRVRQAIADLPAVEIVQLGAAPRRAAIILHASLVGWLGNNELLVAQDGRLAVYDARGIKQRETAIRLRSGADAFLR